MGEAAVSRVKNAITRGSGDRGDHSIDAGFVRRESRRDADLADRTAGACVEAIEGEVRA
jgi:hypothetical protein